MTLAAQGLGRLMSGLLQVAQEVGDQIWAQWRPLSQCSLADQEKTAPLGNVVFFIHVEISEIAKAIFISSVALLNALISHCTRLKCRIVFLE